MTNDYIELQDYFVDLEARIAGFEHRLTLMTQLIDPLEQQLAHLSSFIGFKGIVDHVDESAKNESELKSNVVDQNLKVGCRILVPHIWPSLWQVATDFSIVSLNRSLSDEPGNVVFEQPDRSSSTFIVWIAVTDTTNGITWQRQ